MDKSVPAANGALHQSAFSAYKFTASPPASLLSKINAKISFRPEAHQFDVIDCRKLRMSVKACCMHVLDPG